MFKADLHIHTTASDGILTPSEVVARACLSGLDVIAVTDHDTISGVAEARLAAEESDLKVIQGAEVSTLFKGRECHLLAYSFEDARIMQHLFRDQKVLRIERARSIIFNLNKLGFDLTFDEVLGEAGRASIGRPHIASVMIKKGYASDNQEVFFRYLGEDAAAYHTIAYPDISDAIKQIHKAGGYAILAHPGNTYNFLEIKKMKDSGLDGIECYHPSHNISHQRRYSEYCKNYNLIITGGSDFHGNSHDSVNFGTATVTLDPGSPLLKKTEVSKSNIFTT